MMRAAHLAVALLLLTGLVGCGSWLPPFETIPPPAAAGQGEMTRVAICYNFLISSADDVRKAAAASCGAGAAPQPVDRDLSLNYCPVFTPNRATFACAAPQGAHP